MAAPPAVAVAPNVFRIPTVGAASVNSYAFVDDDGSVTLVDCGVRKARPKIVAGLAAIGKRPSDVQRIVLTHAHVLGELEYERVAFTHGPEIRTGGREVLRRFLARSAASIPERQHPGAAARD